MKKIAKGLVKAVSGIVVLGSGMGLAACNGARLEQTPTPQENYTTVSAIYDDLNSSLDKVGLLQNEVNEIAENVYGDADVKAYGLKDDDLQVISMVGDELSSVVVSLPQETIDYLKGDVKDSVLSKAGLTPQQEVKESEKGQIVEKISNAVDYIESKIGAISDLPVGNVNYYTKGEATENADKTYSVISPVREDGTNVLFTVYENGDLTESVIKINDVGNMTTNEIWEAISQGDYEIISQNELDPSSNYEEPPVEEKITIGEIFDQNFSNVDFSDELENAFEKIYKTCYSSSTAKTKFYAIDEKTNELSLYFELTRNSNGALSFNELKFSVPSSISMITKNMKENLLNIAGYTSQDEIKESEAQEAIDAIQTVIDSIHSDITEVGNTSLSNLSAKTMINHNEEIKDADVFGEALLGNMGEKGTIISTYVGDMSGEILDSAHRFDTGYYTEYNITVVYEKNNQIVISSKTVYNAWYNNSTNESLYSNLLNGNDDFLLVGGNTITIDNPLLLNEKKVEELNISL